MAIGNSVRGTKSLSEPTRDGCLTSGRDFMFTPIGSGSVTTWTLVGGTPLTPAAFSDSTLRQYMQMYQKFRWLGCQVHYITSSPTSANGDVMFYYGKNRDSVFLNQTSTQLLPFVMSDPNTVIGPQWTNHSIDLEVVSDWRSTDYGMSDDPNEYAAGELFLLSRTTTTDSPGYVIFDYQIEFSGMQISPRLLSLPLPRAQYFQTNMGQTAAAVTGGSNASLVIKGNNITGTSATGPASATNLDIYKCFLDVTNSTPASWTGCTTSNVLGLVDPGTGVQSLTLSDGMTIYLVIQNGTTYIPYPNLQSAFSQTNTLQYNVTATITFNLQVWISLVATINTTNLAPNF